MQLTLELAAFQERVTFWELGGVDGGVGDDDAAVIAMHVGGGGKTTSTTRGGKCGSRGAAGGCCRLPLEVVAFQNYVTTHGGHFGGRDDLSHAAFLRLRAKYEACIKEKTRVCQASTRAEEDEAGLYDEDGVGIGLHSDDDDDEDRRRRHGRARSAASRSAWRRA
ncbi:hypothetical protein DFJ73DRAFT_795567 [Zopfochytrium polystomum]|nr:hypothetical protein DFJ73DRAFT_795567 [Zopfochytrium polystomum]